MKDIALLLLLPFISGTLQAQIAAWHFDKIEKTEIVKPLERRKIPSPEVDRSFFVTEDISGAKGKISGSFHKSVEGVVGNALQLDGNTSFIEMPLNTNLKNDFSIGAWIALGAFPTHWCPVADQNINTKKGFFLGIDAYGHAGVKAYIWWEISRNSIKRTDFTPKMDAYSRRFFTQTRLIALYKW